MHQPIIDLSTREGRAIADLHGRIRRTFADRDGWNGGDLVELVDTWFGDLGIDPDSSLPGAEGQDENDSSPECAR